VANNYFYLLVGASDGSDLLDNSLSRGSGIDKDGPESGSDSDDGGVLMDMRGEIELQAFNDDYKLGVEDAGLRCAHVEGCTAEGFEVWKQLEGNPNLTWDEYLNWMKLSEMAVYG
jgi:hypothetical protein